MPERNRLRFSEEEQGENAEEAIQTSSNTKRLFQTKVEGQRAYSTKGKETIPSHSEERSPGDSPSKAEEKAAEEKRKQKEARRALSAENKRNEPVGEKK